MRNGTFSRLALALAFSAATASAAFANDELQALQKDANQWVMPLGNYSGTRYSELAQINKDNVKDLRVAWSFSTGVLRGHEGGPLVIGNMMYVHSPFPNKVFALDLSRNGAIAWSYEPKQDNKTIAVMCCDTVNRGVAYADGKIFLHQADTTLVALDAKTGAVVWSVKNGDPTKGETGTAAPFVVGDKVLIGNSGGEFGVRGHMTAYDLKTGKLIWRAYSSGPDADTLIDPVKTTSMGKPVGKDSGMAGWKGDQWKLGGGTTWGWTSYDPKTNLIYYGSGNPGAWNPVQRPGDNRWSMSIFARDANTGKAKWIYQMTPHDEWDYDGVNEMILVDKPIKGKTRNLLVHFDRNGFAYTLDRVTGELISGEKFDPAVNWASSIDIKTGLPQRVAKYSTEGNGEDVVTEGVCPAALGSKDQQPAAYSPKTGLLYIPGNHVCMNYEPTKVAYVAGSPYVGANLTMFPPKGETNLGRFAAFDAESNKVVWEAKEPFSVWSGALATAGDIVFYGTMEGYLKAVDAKTGKELYKFKTPSGIIGNINTYTYNGKQYVAVLSGVGGWAAIGMAAGLSGDQEGLGAVGAYRSLSQYTNLGGALTVFELP
ncbi:methanol/ethanol family PQQ-dependent dehydrogenase [Caulobacter vibrioides]|jgi:PQQ-dependent dehydrogenase (methanol/ethanol family)|uniref:PQQ-dependent dehydrogenase, methanol/ethanol family n=1 Tax=Caulobacter vibrioides OR37 TaxID=1292034 RepID=R0CYE6_CAUVI|nr:methanol/ethanol family PQQ-dependent dehydrogenase [Caulobacter vibrioides]ENZ81305.1 PQQ-dependent dehydrogenase, methanol/ethanol family [Caulobacter vibrioides OR37]